MPKTAAASLAIAALALAFAAGAQAQAPSEPAPEHATMDHAAHMAEMARAQRQAEVARRGPDVMPFSLPATTHVFTKTASGGLQQVLAREAGDTTQVALVRRHLREIRKQFLAGDFSGPAHIHGHDMPGLATLEAAKPGQLSIHYRSIPGGAELAFRTGNAELVAALHDWFDAQLADHGKDAMAGHAGHEGH